MVRANNLLGYLQRKGFNFFSGVPCSFLKGILKEILREAQKNSHIKYVPAVKEDIALGVSSGAYLAGENSAIFIQNSGLGHIVNSLTSFNLIYRIPVLMFITWRGYKGKDAPEHIIMGRKTIVLLKDLGIPYRILSAEYAKDIDWAMNVMKNKLIPAALIVKKNIIK